MASAAAKLKAMIPLNLRVALRRAPRLLRPASAYALPDYIIIGAQKAGTTSLDLNLAKHPCARTSLVQEVHFYDYNYHRGLNWYRRHFHTLAQSAQNQQQRGCRLFSGESSPYYIYHPLSPRRIRETLPDVRLIALLRNPVDRLYSHYHHEKRYGWDTMPLDEALRNEEQRLAGEEDKMRADERYFSYAHRHYSYQARGRYAEQLERWYALFPKEQILVLCSEEFYADMPAVLARCAAFIGLPAHEWPRGERMNANTYEKIEPGLRAQLSAYFKPHNERLYAMIGRRFAWDD